MTRIVVRFAAPAFIESDSNNGPSPGHFNLVSDEVYICSSLLLMISWWLPYLAKGSMLDFNNDPANDSNSGCILALQCSFESSLNNGPFPSHSNLVSDGVYVCSGLLLRFPIGCHICPRAAGLTSIMAYEMTRILALFWAPGVCLSPTRIMAPSLATPILYQMKYTSVQVSYL